MNPYKSKLFNWLAYLGCLAGGATCLALDKVNIAIWLAIYGVAHLLWLIYYDK